MWIYFFFSFRFQLNFAPTKCCFSLFVFSTSSIVSFRFDRQFQTCSCRQHETNLCCQIKIMKMKKEKQKYTVDEKRLPGSDWIFTFYIFKCLAADRASRCNRYHFLSARRAFFMGRSSSDGFSSKAERHRSCLLSSAAHDFSFRMASTEGKVKKIQFDTCIQLRNVRNVDV